MIDYAKEDGERKSPQKHQLSSVLNFVEFCVRKVNNQPHVTSKTRSKCGFMKIYALSNESYCPSLARRISV